MKIGTFDLEADGFLDTVTQVWCGVVKEHGGERRSFRPENIAGLIAYLDTFDVLIGHNCIAYDFAVLRKLFGWTFDGRVVDTLLMSRLQRPNRMRPPHMPASAGGPHSVAAWGYRLGRGKVTHEDWTRFSEEMLHRCEEDVEIQVLIYDELLKEGKGEGWTNAHRLNFRLFSYLQLQEELGWPVDVQQLARSVIQLERWMERIVVAVREHLPLVVEINETKKDGEYGYVKKPFKKDGTLAAISSRFMDDCYGGTDNPPSIVGQFSRVSFRRVSLDKNVELKALLLSLGWEPEQWNTNNEGKRTSPKLSVTDPFHGVQSGLGKLAAKYVQCKQRLGVLNGWRELIRPDGRISAQQSGLATTGRLKHKGIANVPRPTTFFGGAMRACFASEPGYVLVGCDSKGNQMRQLAARMGNEEFTTAVLTGSKADGTDEHSLTAKKAGIIRDKGKTLNYTIIFGAGDTKAGRVVGGGAKEGKRLKEMVFAGIPGLEELIISLQTQWRNSAKKWYNKKYGRMEYRDGFITGLDGRPILVDSEHKVLNYTLQSDEAIQMAAAYVWFNKQMEDRGYVIGDDYWCVIWYHDEFQVHCKVSIAEEVAELAEQAIAWAGEFFKIPCPHEGDATIGRNWKETH